MKVFAYLVVIGLLLHGCAAACTNPVPNAAVPPGFCATIWASGLNQPRAIITVSNGDIIVTESGLSQLSLFYAGSSGQWQKMVLATANGLDHAVLIQGAYIYASSASTVYRWRFTPGNRTNLGSPEQVIVNIPTGGHSTRSLIFDKSNGNLLVQVGSQNNVDNNPGRAGIRTFDLDTKIPQDFSTGAWFAEGLRNEVGLRYDNLGNLWGVENGMDNLNRPDLGGDIHLGNPGEELNMFAAPGKFYGYPYCWSQYNLSTVTTPRGTQYGLDQFMRDGTHTDDWCQNPSNVIQPKYQLHPHIAPLDLWFYNGTSFPGYSGDLFVSEHGSWNSVPPYGYRVERIHFDNGEPVSDDPFFWYNSTQQTGPGWHRPVGITFTKGPDGTDQMLVTSDATGVIVSIQYPASNKVRIN